MLKVGITGGIGSGKSTVAKLFSLLGIPIYESDKRAKWLIENDFKMKDEIKQLFGEEAYLVDGSYNKDFVAKLVFKDNSLLQKLNKIVHPSVGRDFDDWANAQNSLFVMKEAAIMDKNAGLDKIIFVDSPRDLRIKRILLRDKHRNTSQIGQVIENQKTEEQFREVSDYVLINNDEDLLIPQVLEIYNKLRLIS